MAGRGAMTGAVLLAALALGGCGTAAPAPAPAPSRPAPTGLSDGRPAPLQEVAPARSDSTQCPPAPGPPRYSTPPTFPRTVALTFDDGPSPAWTAQFVAVLGRRHVHGTFFEVGRRVAQHPELTRLVAAAGDLVEDHTWTHPEQGRGIDGLTPAAMAGELRRTADEIQAVTGRRPCLVRAPQGKDKGPVFQAEARHEHLAMINMIGTAHDYQQPPRPDPAWVARITSLLVDRGDHPIILIHDGGGYRGNGLAALDRVISWYEARHYVFTDPLGRPFPARP